MNTFHTEIIVQVNYNYQDLLVEPVSGNFVEQQGNTSCSRMAQSIQYKIQIVITKPWEGNKPGDITLRDLVWSFRPVSNSLWTLNSLHIPCLMACSERAGRSERSVSQTASQPASLTNFVTL